MAKKTKKEKCLKGGIMEKNKYCKKCGQVLYKEEGYVFDENTGEKIVISNYICPVYLIMKMDRYADGFTDHSRLIDERLEEIGWDFPKYYEPLIKRSIEEEKRVGWWARNIGGYGEY